MNKEEGVVLIKKGKGPTKILKINKKGEAYLGLEGITGDVTSALFNYRFPPNLDQARHDLSFKILHYLPYSSSYWTELKCSNSS